MMPRPSSRRNRTIGRGARLFCAAALYSCSDAIDLRISLVPAIEPDPFRDVERVRVVGLVSGEARPLEEVRWDQGPVELKGRLPLDVERVWVEGLDAGGRVRSAALGPPVDFLTDAPERLDLLFARVGALSIVPGSVAPRRGWRAASLGEGGVLLLGGQAPSGATPEGTVQIGPSGELTPGPSLPGGRVGADVVTTGRSVVVWGGLTRVGDELTPAREWARLGPGSASATASNPVQPGSPPVAVDGDGRRVVVFALERMAVAELDVADLRGRVIGRFDWAGPGAAFARLSAQQVLVVGGAGQETAFVYDRRTAGRIARSVPLLVSRVGAAAKTTSAVSTVVIGGNPEGASPAVTIRFPVPVRGTDSGTVSAFSSAPDLGEARLVDAGGGRLVAASVAAPRGPYGIDLMSGSVEPLLPLGVAFDLAKHPDGTLRGAADDGRLLVFSPGPGIFAPSLATGDGLVPRPPGSWRVEGGGVVGQASSPALPGAVRPDAWVVLGETRYQDFSWEATVTPIGRGTGAFVFDLGDEGYDLVVLQRAAQVRAGPDRPRIPCPAAEVPELDEGRGAVRIRLARMGAILSVDVGADGAIELSCALPAPSGGRLAFAVLRGAVRFSELRLSARTP